VWIGNIDDKIKVKEIETNSILLNGSVKVEKVVGFEKKEGFKGKALHLQYKKYESFKTIFKPELGPDKREVCIEGKLKNGENFIGRDFVEIVGKKENKKENGK
ncbi:hypothetical protein J7L48_09585, partial [bacterium]|nr:hypothetical protein [bacterium]